MSKPHILVTGTKSGLGKYLCERFQGISYTRETSLTEIAGFANTKSFTAIIHTAYNAAPLSEPHYLNQYLDENLQLTQKLLTIPHQKFIFISSTDVYPKDFSSINTTDVDVRGVKGAYALSKLMSECAVMNHTKNSLILRPSVLLGKYARLNSLIKMFVQKTARLTLAENSIFNYVLHSDIGNFIETALSHDIRGIYNLISSSNITLQEITKAFNLDVFFGDYQYITPNVSNKNTLLLCKDFNKTSLQNLLEFKEKILPVWQEYHEFL